MRSLAAFLLLSLACGAQAIGFRHHQRPTGPADYQETISFQQQFSGSGTVGVMAKAMNSIATGNFGACNTASTIAERVGPVLYIFLRQMTNGSWFGYEADTSEAGANVSPPNIRSYSIYKAMKRILYSNGACSDGDGGAVNIPIQSAQLWIKCNVGSVSATATRLGVIFGLGANNDGVVRVSITNASGTVFTPNLIPTAQNLVDNGHLTNTALVANGGTLNPTDRVIGTEIAAIGWSGGVANRYNHLHIPVADGLAAGAYIVTLEYTPYGYMQDGTATDRFYGLYFTYGDDTMGINDAGVQMQKMDWWTGENDGSANESFTLECRPAGSGAYTIIGGDHGNEFNVSDPTFTLDGTQIYLHSRSSTRARSSNVSTIVTATSHGLTTGDLATVSGVGGSSYNAEGVSVTVVTPTSFTYSNTGSNEGTTSDTGGRVINQKVFTGNKLIEARSTLFTHPSFQTGTGTVATATATYTFDKFGVMENHTVTTSTALDFNTQTYIGLGSAWHGNAIGPCFPDMSQWRRLGSRTVSGTLDPANAAILALDAGSHNGYVRWSLTTGKANVLYCDSLIQSTANFANSAAPFIQDRALNTLSKVYFPFCSGSPILNVAQGTTFSGQTRRFDTVFADANLICH